MESMMKNIILQHWHGDIPRWANICKNSIEDYSRRIEADYELLQGFPMGDWFPNTKTKPWLVIQKIFMLNEKYDEYDNVLMLDMDMLFTGKLDNIFIHNGVGRLHKVGMRNISGSKNGRKWPKLYTRQQPMFFGNCVKFTREQRINLRKELNTDVIHNSMSSDGLPPNDEIIMHYLIVQSGILDNKTKLEIPHDRFCDLPEEAAPDATLVHYCGNRKNYIK